jgi:hypothetical protein
MSAQYRTESTKLKNKYCRTFGVDIALVAYRNQRGEDEIYCPSRPELPAWGMGSNGEDWQDGPNRPRNLRHRSDKPQLKIVSKRKR